MRIRRKLSLYEVTNLETGEKRRLYLKQKLKVGDMCGIGKRKLFTYKDYIKITKVEKSHIEAESSYGFERYLLKRV